MKRNSEKAHVRLRGNKVIPIAKPIIGKDETEAVAAVLNSGVLAQGKRVEEFEEDFAEFIGAKYAIATSSGTAALHIALLANEIGNEDEVITSPLTFIATANSIIYTWANPVFADIDEGSFNIDPSSIEKKITSKTKAIMPVHLYGQPCDMDSIMKLAEKHGLRIIEDACQAHGAEYRGIKVGSFGTGCFSFYPTKNMTTGEGGMITTNDDIIADKARKIRNHGQNKRYVHELLGYNYRMTDIAAAIGICQLKKLEQFNRRRIYNATILTNGLRGIDGLILPQIKPNAKHVFHQFTIRIKEDFSMPRDTLKERLYASNIASGIYYPLPIYKQPIYKKLGYKDYLPNTEIAVGEVLSLPVHPSLSNDDLNYIIKTLSGIC